MSVLVDYRCPACDRREEVWAATPPAQSRPCSHCGSEARRVWSPFGIGRPSSPSGGTSPAAGPGAGSGAPLCVSNPDVPGLCHMTPSAGRAWLARARKDGRALDRELERQEAAAGTARPTIDDVVSHHHSHPGHPHPGRSDVEHSHVEHSHVEHSHPGRPPHGHAEHGRSGRGAGAPGQGAQ